MDILKDLFYFGNSHITVLFGIIVFLWILWGLRPGFQAIRHLKITEPDEEAVKQLAQAIRSTVDNYKTPLTILTGKTLYDAYKAHKQATMPIFLKALEDSTEQIMENFFENRYIRPISMYSNLLPPIGFIGTIIGMILVFSTKGATGSQVNATGLGVALLSTLYALSGFVVIEIIKMWFVNRASHCIDNGIKLFYVFIEGHYKAEQKKGN
ncbi:MAG: MotA/TolQ/ExbB proton channel family protein [Thermodesulfobacteriota bacterium]|nr:MotA/TolQ/ExbB proton channel family protein [Thermodesulfobacteriota bacterium]